MQTSLLICAQDIQEFHVALLQEKEIVKEADHAVPPESYLKALAQTLSLWEIDFANIQEIVIVTGPGSFTASRVSVTIANTLAFTNKIPLYGIENKDKLELSELWKQHKDTLPPPCDMVLPSYDREATITQPKK